MASLSDIKRRIGSVKNTRKITRAMKLVAAAKLRKATEAAVAARPYQKTLNRVLQNVTEAEEGIEHPMLTIPENKKDVLVVIISSDRGLCGGFNSQLFRYANQEIKRYEDDGKSVKLALYGRKAKAAFKSTELETLDVFENIEPDKFVGYAEELTEKLTVMLNENAFEKAVLVFNRFESVMTQTPTTAQALPMKLENDDSEESLDGDYLYEPDGAEILSELLPMALRTQILQAFLEKEAGEQAARMQAMENATKNAGEMIDKLTLVYNRARQAAITKELIEIISGAEAL